MTAHRIKAQNFTLRETHLVAAYEALIEAVERDGTASDGTASDGVNATSVRSAGSLKRAFILWGWKARFKEGDLTRLVLEPEELDEAQRLFQAIGPFVVAGSFLNLCDGEGGNWRYYFDGQKCIRQVATLTYEDVPSSLEARLPPDRISEVPLSPREWLHQAGSLGPDETPPDGSNTLRTRAEWAEGALRYYGAKTGRDMDVEPETVIKDVYKASAPTVLSLMTDKNGNQYAKDESGNVYKVGETVHPLVARPSCNNYAISDLSDQEIDEKLRAGGIAEGFVNVYAKELERAAVEATRKLDYSLANIEIHLTVGPEPVKPFRRDEFTVGRLIAQSSLGAPHPAFSRPTPPEREVERQALAQFTNNVECATTPMAEDRRRRAYRAILAHHEKYGLIFGGPDDIRLHTALRELKLGLGWAKHNEANVRGGRMFDARLRIGDEMGRPEYAFEAAFVGASRVSHAEADRALALGVLKIARGG